MRAGVCWNAIYCGGPRGWPAAPYDYFEGAGSSSYPYAGINRIRFNGSALWSERLRYMTSPRSGANSNANEGLSPNDQSSCQTQ
jgi:hypothetical protein